MIPAFASDGAAQVIDDPTGRLVEPRSVRRHPLMRLAGMPMTRPFSRWGRVVAAIYVGMAVIAGGLAVQGLAVSTEMPGLAA